MPDRDGSSSRTKVLYVAGFERSGTTILSRVLGQLDGFFATGEVNHLWGRGLVSNIPCGCGQSVRECPIWKDVVDHERVSEVNAEHMRSDLQYIANKHLVFDRLPITGSRLRSRLAGMAPSLAALYAAISEVAGCRVIVDSSKQPLYAEALECVPSIDLYLVHMIRNPFGVLYSQIKRKESGHSYYANHHSTTKSSLNWNLVNSSLERFWRNRSRRYLPIKYEDFVTAPEKALASILELIGEEAALPDLSGGVVDVAATHSIAGSHRFDRGQIRLTPDEQWRDQLSPGSKRLIRLLSGPLLRRYAYELD